MQGGSCSSSTDSTLSRVESVDDVYEGRNVEDVGGMKDEELKFEEIDSSHTLGGTGKSPGERRGCRCYSDVIVTHLDTSISQR